MEDFRTLWRKVLAMPGENNADRITALLETLSKEEGREFLLMLQDPRNRPIAEEVEERI